MICLDTNDLILGLVGGAKEESRLIAWAETGETLITPAIAWYEFLCGPVTPLQVAAMSAFLREIVTFDGVLAIESARLQALC